MQTKYLRDYQPPAFLVDQINLTVILDPVATEVRAGLKLHANPSCTVTPQNLRLDGCNLHLHEVALDGIKLPSSAYQTDETGLTIPNVPKSFALETRVTINPDANTALEGLYRSHQIYCTQCEAQGFRKITYFPDRPDVMARFMTTLVGDPDDCPVLLSNGNLVDAGVYENGRHFAVYDDPFPKPSYLFALVAGRLAVTEGSFSAASGRDIRLQIFVEERNLDQCEHALRSLKNAMQWDEMTYGLECDLDEYKIVAVDDFNMGAMENKGLNIFNSKYVLADPQTATDSDFQAIESVIGHEYFHNWTGNRVTCRDWFQLSLKEGLTVFRDQEFSADMGSPAVKRISDVRVLRNHQFPEDNGPMAHPVRPDSYIEINNFYTATVYNKGAEVIRMYRTLLGSNGFKEGLRLYLERHDGQAVTIEDFLTAMADANQTDFSQMRRWYDQAGTPVLDVTGEYDEEAREFHLHIRQSCSPTPGQPEKDPFLIPLAVGLIGPDGIDIPLQSPGESGPEGTTRILRVTAKEQSFSFVNVAVEPVPSMLRGFSAPVRLNYPFTANNLAFQLAHDSDSFNRWDAGQRLATEILLEMVADIQDGWQPAAAAFFLKAFRDTLVDTSADPALLALALTLPSETEIAELMIPVDPEAIHTARQQLRLQLAEGLRNELTDVMAAMREHGAYQLTADAIGRRSLKNLCLAYLIQTESEDIAKTCFDQFVEADNMTDRLAALQCLTHSTLAVREDALDAFHYQYQDNPLVIDKWFSLQATSPRPDTLDRVAALADHPSFNIQNPNRVRALIGAFCHGNPVLFHKRDGAGYVFLADHVLEIDRFNPQAAARLAGALSRWKRYDDHRQKLMQSQLERIQRQSRLSKDVREIVQKSLAS